MATPFSQRAIMLLNANDAYSNALGIKQPQDKYYYPGGSIGGPVLIPWTRFNHDRNKLFFFTGYEYFYQVLDTQQSDRDSADAQA